MPKVLGAIGAVFAVGMTTLMVATQAWVLAPMIIFLCLEFLIITWFLRRVGSTEITLGPAGIEVQNCAKHFFIAYNEIERIDSGSIPYFGGWARIKAHNGETVRVTVTLEGVSRFLSELKQRVDRNNLQAVYNRQRLFGFFKTATYCEQSWRRMGKAALPFVLASAFLPNIFRFTGPLVAIPAGAGLLVYLWCEFVFGRHIARNADPVMFTAPDRDNALEKRTYMHAAVAWFVVVVPSVAMVLLT